MFCALIMSLVWTQEPKPPGGPSGPPAAKPAEPEPPLYEQRPFDVMELDEANQNARLRVVPLPIPQRRVPNWAADTRFVIRLVENDEEEYEVRGRNIRSIKLFEDLLLAEGKKLVEAAKARQGADKSRLLDEAFRYFYRVQLSDPKYPGLREAVNEYLFWDAGTLNAQERYLEAIAVLDELYQRDPGFKLTPASRPLGEVMNIMIDRVLARLYDSQN
jgi:hypothetical protein